MEIPVAQLAIAVIIIEIVGEVNGLPLAGDNFCRPAVIETQEFPASLRLGFWKSDGTAPHRCTGGEGDATLPVVIHGTIEMIDHTIMLQNIAFMCEHLVVFLRGPDEVFTLPALPMNQVTTDGKGVEGIVFPRGVVSHEIEHDVKVSHLGYLGIACYNTAYLVGKDRITVKALPFLQVVGKGDADALGFQLIGGIDATGVVEHHKTIVAHLWWQ